MDYGFGFLQHVLRHFLCAQDRRTVSRNYDIRIIRKIFPHLEQGLELHLFGYVCFLLKLYKATIIEVCIYVQFNDDFC